MLLMTDGGASYLLIGGDRQLIMSGNRVEVTGKVQPDLMTTCQQGTPFAVATVRKI
jgi:mannose/fructose/N-acetylgalactosamine-specific phosphotransferase system component IIC